MRTLPAILVLLSGSLLISRPAAADPRCDGQTLAALDRAIADDAAASRAWYYGWTGTYFALTIGQLAFAGYTTDPALRLDARVGAFMSSLGLLATVVLPPPTLFVDRLGPWKNEPGSVSPAACERLRDRLAGAASHERFGTGWLKHTGTIVANLGAGLYLWLHHDRLGTGILQAVAGIAVSEFQIFTHPTNARDAIAATVVPSVVPGGASVSVSLVF